MQKKRSKESIEVCKQKRREIKGERDKEKRNKLLILIRASTKYNSAFALATIIHEIQFGLFGLVIGWNFVFLFSLKLTY